MKAFHAFGGSAQSFLVAQHAVGSQVFPQTLSSLKEGIVGGHVVAIEKVGILLTSYTP